MRINSCGSALFVLNYRFLNSGFLRLTRVSSVIASTSAGFRPSLAYRLGQKDANMENKRDVSRVNEHEEQTRESRPKMAKKKHITLEQVKALLASSAACDAQKDSGTTLTIANPRSGAPSHRRHAPRRWTVNKEAHYNLSKESAGSVYVLGHSMTPMGCQCALIRANADEPGKGNRGREQPLLPKTRPKESLKSWLKPHLLKMIPSFLRKRLLRHSMLDQVSHVVVPGMLPGLLVRIPESFLSFVQNRRRLPRASRVHVIRRVRREVLSASEVHLTEQRNHDNAKRRSLTKWKSFTGWKSLPVTACPYARTALCNHCPWMMVLPGNDSVVEDINSDSDVWKVRQLKQDFKRVAEKYQQKKDVELWRKKAHTKSHSKADLNECRKQMDEEITAFRRHRAKSLKSVVPECLLPLSFRPVLHRSQECHLVYIPPTYKGLPETHSPSTHDDDHSRDTVSGLPVKTPSSAPSSLSLVLPRFTLLDASALASSLPTTAGGEDAEEKRSALHKTLFSPILTAKRTENIPTTLVEMTEPSQLHSASVSVSDTSEETENGWLEEEVHKARREEDDRLKSLGGGKQLFLTSSAALAARETPKPVHCSWCSLEQQRLMKTLSDWAAQLPRSMQYCPMGATVLQLYSTGGSGSGPSSVDPSLIAYGDETTARHSAEENVYHGKTRTRIRELDVFQVVVWVREDCENPDGSCRRTDHHHSFSSGGEQSPSPLCGPSHPPSMLSSAEQQLVEAVQRAAPLASVVEVFLCVVHVHPSGDSTNYFNKTQSALHDSERSFPHRLQRLTHPLSRSVHLEQEQEQEQEELFSDSLLASVPRNDVHDSTRAAGSENSPLSPPAKREKEDENEIRDRHNDLDDDDDDESGLPSPRAVPRRRSATHSIHALPLQPTNKACATTTINDYRHRANSIATRTVTGYSSSIFSLSIRCGASPELLQEEVMNVKHEPKKKSKSDDDHQPTAKKTDSLEETETSITLRGIPRIPAAVYHLFLPHPVLDAQLVQLTPTRYDNSKGMNRSHREIARAHNEGLLPTLVNNPLVSSMLLSRVPFWRHTGALDLVLSMVLTVGLADHECPAKHEWMTSSSNPGLSLDGVGIETHECRHPLSAIVFCCSKSLLPSSRIRLLEGWSRSDRGIVPKDVDERLKRSKGHPSSPLSSLQRHPHPRWNYCGIPSSDVMKYYHEEQATGNCETSADVVSATALLSDTLLTLTSEMNQRLARRGTTSIDYGAIPHKDESSRTGTARPSIYSSLRSSFVNSDLVYDSDDTDFVLVSNGSWNIKDQEMMSESPSAPIPLLLVVVPPFDKQQKQENGGKCTIGDFVFNDAVKPLIERLEPYCGNPVLSKSPLTHQSLLCRVLMLQCSSDLSFSPLAEAYFDLVDSISAISCGTVEKRSWSQQRCGIVDVDPMTSSAVGYVVMDLIGSGSAVSSA